MFLEILLSDRVSVEGDSLKPPSCLDLLRFAEAVQWGMAQVVEEVPKLVPPVDLPFVVVVFQSPSWNEYQP